MSQNFDYAKCKAAMEDNLPKSFRSQDNGQWSRSLCKVPIDPVDKRNGMYSTVLFTDLYVDT